MQVNASTPVPADEQGFWNLNLGRPGENLEGLRQYYVPPDPGASPVGRALQQLGTRLAAPFRAFYYESPFTAPGTGIFRRPYRPTEPWAPVSQDRAVAAAREAQGLPATPTPSAAEEADWSGLVEALGNLGGGGGGYTPVRVQRDLFQLAQTPEEQALLDRELADIEARRSAGSEALGAGWSQLSQANAAAAEKARQQVMQYGDAAAAAWTDAANRARALAAERAQAAGAAAGRQSINVSPSGGAADFIAFMESQAPAARQFAGRTQETLASDLDWLASTAGAQGQAYQGELQRQANVLAFERAREHNRAVQERIAAERMALADMEFRAASTNAQLAQAAAQQTGRGASEIQGALTTALFAGDAQGPAVLASLLGLAPEQALGLYNSAKSSPLGISLQTQAAGR